MLPVIDAQCRYFSSALYDDLIIIRTRLEFVKGTRLKFLYDIMRKEDNKLLAQGYTEHPFTNLEKAYQFKKSCQKFMKCLQNAVIKIYKNGIKYYKNEL